jgi:2-polyprenyl-3-methyl-5-hydroxy-6-metoxy-1,4-benzoquinol methylase
MHWLDIPRVDEPEMIDAPDQPIEDLAASMGDVARTNSLFGGTKAIVDNVASLLKTTPKDRSIRILDIGTGTADIPRALVRWGRANGRPIHVVAVDNLWSMLSIAKSPSELEEPEYAERHIEFVQADALALPFAAGAFDIATCALTFHHVGFDGSARVLAQMDRLTTHGFVATDLRRDRLSLGIVSTGLALLRSHPFTRHDGPASIRRAFTPREYEKIIALSGVRDVRMTSSWYYRMVLVKDKSGRH